MPDPNPDPNQNKKAVLPEEQLEALVTRKVSGEQVTKTVAEWLTDAEKADIVGGNLSRLLRIS